MGNKIKRNDTVRVIAGREKGKIGKVLRVTEGGKRVVVEKTHIVKRHTKPSQKYPQGGIIDLEAPVDVSNVMLVSPTTGEAFRPKFKLIEGEDGRKTKVRYNPKTGETLD
jgi:large subunit ribosomal protein L24